MKTCEICLKENDQLVKAKLRVFGQKGWEELEVSACPICVREEGLEEIKEQVAA
jgi:hypothetical protein